MIVRDGIEFHNVADLQAADGLPGLRLQRLPDPVRAALNPGARDGALCPSSCELRFVTSADEVAVTLFSEVHHEYVQTLQGDFIVEEAVLAPRETKTLTVRPAPLVPALMGRRSGAAFAPGVCRLKLSGTGRVHYVSAATADGSPLRPPSPNEKPARRWLAYGSSITHGFSAPHLSQPYIVCAARALGVDVLNLGFGGACHVETELADHFAARPDWDLATLELGVNLIDHSMPDEEFARRVGYMADALTGSRPDCPVALITVFPVHHDLRPEDDPRRARTERFRRIVRDAHAARRERCPNLYLIEGADVLDDWTGLTADLCHPSEYGHARMGMRLAERLRPILSVGAQGGPARPGSEIPHERQL
jgi:lysophospholipase L1-like esterase